MRKLAATLIAAALVVSLSACGREVDTSAVNAHRVNGTGDLWWFCNESTLIYLTKRNGEDEYEAFFAFGCNPDGTMAYTFNPTDEAQGNGEK